MKHDNRLVGYSWIPLSAELDQEGEDIRDTLSMLGMAINALMLTPDLGRSTTIENAAEEFPRPLEVGVASPQHTVVRLTG